MRALRKSFTVFKRDKPFILTARTRFAVDFDSFDTLSTEFVSTTAGLVRLLDDL
jgi:hypothetical protein